MTSLRSGLKVNLLSQRKPRRHRAPPKLKHQPTKKATRKTKPITKTVTRQLTARSKARNAEGPSPNVGQRQGARGDQLGSVDGPTILRNKRRWVQHELEAGRISGKSARELHDLYNKKNLGNVRRQRRLATNLTEAAKEAKLRLEEVFEQVSGAATVADAASQTLDEPPNNAGKISSATEMVLEDSHVNNCRGIEDPTDGQIIVEPPYDDAADLAAEDDLDPVDSTETEDESTSEEEDFVVSHADQTRVLPANPAEANDVAARQRVLKL